MIFLLISTVGKASWVAMAQGGEVVKCKKWQTSRASADILVGVEEILTGKRVNKIGVVRGPGGFTAARVGVVVANALAKSWGVKVVGLVGNPEPEELAEEVDRQEGAELVEPYYEYAPHITTPKKL